LFLRVPSSSFWLICTFAQVSSWHA
jgi:hypothetical protein